MKLARRLCIETLRLQLHLRAIDIDDIKGVSELRQLIHENNSAAYDRYEITANDGNAVPDGYEKHARKGERAVNDVANREDGSEPREKREPECFGDHVDIDGSLLFERRELYPSPAKDRVRGSFTAHTDAKEESDGSRGVDD